MKPLIFTLLLFCTFSLCAQDYHPQEVIVKFRADAAFSPSALSLGIPELDELGKAHRLAAIQPVGNRREGRSYLLRFAGQPDIPKLVAAYAKTGYFEYTEPNYIGHSGGQAGVLPDDAFFNRQYALVNDGSFPLSPATADADIDMDDAWEITQGSSDVIVAILDSGFKLNHPEVANRSWFNPGEANDNADNDSNGYTDDLAGWDFAYDDNSPMDDYGHGTNVGGILGATGNNGIGYAGVDWNCQLMFLKILDVNDSGFYTWWADAIYYAVDHGARVLNMSVGGSGFSNLLQEAVDYAHANGATIVACMMNTNSALPFYPAAFANTIAVGATNPDDSRAVPFFWSPNSGSSFGSHIDLVAPGNYMYGLQYNSDTNYNSYWGGTSQATPLVAGVAALLLAQDPGLQPEDIRAILQQTAEDQVGPPDEDTPGFDNYFGHGRLNAFAALQTVVSATEAVLEPLPLDAFPNPAAAQSTLRWAQNRSGRGLLQAYSSNGQLVQQWVVALEQGQEIIDLDDWPAGLYTLSLKSENGQPLGTTRLLLKE